jgi:hypothetical protein
MHNRLENGCGARVALCAHPTHPDTDGALHCEIFSQGNKINEHQFRF